MEPTLHHDNSTSQQPNSRLIEFEQRFISWLMVVYLLISLAGITGNLIVILVILEFTRLGTVTDIFILNLAFADLMFVMGLIFLVITMHLEVWIFGNAICKIFLSTTSLNQFASSLLLVVMSFDRYLAVCHPIYAQSFRQPRRAKIICLCIWFVCLVLQTPVLIFGRTDEKLTCAVFWPEYPDFDCERAFTWSSFAIGFFIPLLLIAASYTRVVRRLRQSANQPMFSTSSRRFRSNRRIERLVIAIIFVYVICWMPYWINQMIVSYLTTDDPHYAPYFWFLIHIATSLSYTNSALNPILYAFLSDNFKRRFSEILLSIRPSNWWGRSPLQTNTSIQLVNKNSSQSRQNIAVKLEKLDEPRAQSAENLSPLARVTVVGRQGIKGGVEAQVIGVTLEMEHASDQRNSGNSILKECPKSGRRLSYVEHNRGF